MGLSNLPIHQSWRLNERHYGALEGIERWAAIKKFGIWPILNCQIKFTASPPPLDPQDNRFPGNQPRYSGIDSTRATTCRKFTTDTITNAGLLATKLLRT